MKFFQLIIFDFISLLNKPSGGAKSKAEIIPLEPDAGNAAAGSGGRYFAPRQGLRRC